MEIIYTFDSWVKEVIDNNSVNILREFHANGIGESGKQELVKMAECTFKCWTDYYKLLKTKRVTIYVCVYANEVLSDGLLGIKEEGVIYKKLVKLKPHGKRG